MVCCWAWPSKRFLPYQNVEFLLCWIPYAMWMTALCFILRMWKTHKIIWCLVIVGYCRTFVFLGQSFVLWFLVCYLFVLLRVSLYEIIVEPRKIEPLAQSPSVAGIPVGIHYSLTGFCLYIVRFYVQQTMFPFLFCCFAVSVFT